MHPNAWRKIVCAHFPWNNLYFSRNSHFIFFIFFRYHFHWYSIRYGNCSRWGSQQLDMNVNIKLNNYQNIIRADSENSFNGGGKGLQTLISRTQKLLQQITSWPPVLTSPPPHPALLAVTQIFHYEQNQQMSVELICDPVLDGENPPFATEWPPSTLKNRGHNSACCCQVGRPNEEGGRVQLKTGLKLWQNILHTVRRIDFQIIEVKGIAVIFIYSKSSSLNFQLLVEVVIKKAMGIFAWQAPINFFFRFIYFLWFLILVRVSGHGNKAIQFGRGNQVFVVQSQARKSNFCLRGCSSLFWLLRVK